MSDHDGIWTSSLRTWTCDSCGRDIFPGEKHVYFPYFPGRTHSVACRRCAEKPRVPEVVTLASMSKYLAELVDCRTARAAGE